MSTKNEDKIKKCSPRSLLNSFLCDTMQFDSIAMNDKITLANEKNQIIAKLSQGMPKGQPKIETTAMSNDELFLMIDDGTGINNVETDTNVEYRQYYLNKKLDLAVAATKVSVNNANTMPKQKSSTSRKLEFDALRQNCHNKRLIKHLCENINQQQIRHRRMPVHGNKEKRMHYEIDKLMIELQRLSNNEEQLMKNLCTKCERYRNQNNKYMTNLRLKLCIDEVQHNLDVYAKDIIENELQLHEIQREIQQKYEILCNLTKITKLFNKTVHESDDKTFSTTILSNNRSLII